MWVQNHRIQTYYILVFRSNMIYLLGIFEICLLFHYIFRICFVIDFLYLIFWYEYISAYFLYFVNFFKLSYNSLSSCFLLHISRFFSLNSLYIFLASVWIISNVLSPKIYIFVISIYWLNFTVVLYLFGFIFSYRLKPRLHLFSILLLLRIKLLDFLSDSIAILAISKLWSDRTLSIFNVLIYSFCIIM